MMRHSTHSALENQLSSPGVQDRPRSTRDDRMRRIIDAAAITAMDDPETILYQHTVFCQTGMPYRNPGDDVTSWERVNGHVHMAISAGKAMHPVQRCFVQLGLPYGPKPRLILAHLNSEALRRQSPEIEVEASLTAFVKRLELATSGRTINTIKDQLSRLSAAQITLGTVRDGEAVTVNGNIVSAFNLWFPKGEGQRVLWPSMLRLSTDYFNSLTRHAVPLHDRALMALSGNAMALDLYSWLAQKLHRINPAKPALVPWPELRQQFGWSYEHLIHFRPVFRRTLDLVTTQYRAARVNLDGRGLLMQCSASPVRGRTTVVVTKDCGSAA